MVGTGTRGKTRSAILRAASDVVRAKGAGSLTLDAVAATAGLSKGGLLYHFATKDALVEGMVEDVLARFEEDVNSAARSEPPGSARWLRAFVRVTFAAQPEHDLSAGLMAAAALNPALLAPVGAYFSRWQERAVEDGIEPTVATLIRLATDGLWFADLFDAAPPDAKLRASLLQLLLDELDRAGMNENQRDE